MLSIGEFSKICEVSTKTLRHYEEIGLLCPYEVNPENGYRYYSLEQLKSILFIKRLKAYHFSLEEIKAILKSDEDPSQEYLQQALSRKKKEIESSVNELESILQQISSDIQNIKNGIPVMSYLETIEVQLVETTPMKILYLRKTMSIEECKAGYGECFCQLYEKMVTHKLTPLGAPMTIYHSPEYDPEGFDIEFAIPVKESIGETRAFAGRACVKTVLRGPYSELTSVYARQREWAENEGYNLAGPPYEVYVSDPAQAAAPEEIVTEIYFPINKK